MMHMHDMTRAQYIRPPRWADNGHRSPLDPGSPFRREPRQTRSLPAWYWPFELFGRWETRLLARAERKGKPVEFWEKP